MMGEFVEPWTFDKTSISGDKLTDSTGGVVAGWNYGESVCPSLHQMCRIAACINFLAGVPTEDLETLMNYKAGLDHIRWEIGVFAMNARGDGKKPLPPHPHWK